MRSVLVKPLFTEKSTHQRADQHRYGFLVTTHATKLQIAQEIKKRYSVTVVQVRTILVKGKPRTQLKKGGRYTGKTSSYKKALVTIPKDQKIEIFEEA